VKNSDSPSRLQGRYGVLHNRVRRRKYYPAWRVVISILESVRRIGQDRRPPLMVVRRRIARVGQDVRLQGRIEIKRTIVWSKARLLIITYFPTADMKNGLVNSCADKFPVPWRESLGDTIRRI
jgi:hypothetical protein